MTKTALRIFSLVLAFLAYHLGFPALAGIFALVGAASPVLAYLVMYPLQKIGHLVSPLTKHLLAVAYVLMVPYLLIINLFSRGHGSMERYTERHACSFDED